MFKVLLIFLKYIAKFVLLFIVYLVSCATIAKYYYNYNNVESILFSVLWPFEQTIRSSDFSDKNFCLVRYGMHLTEVTHLIGEPLLVDIFNQNGLYAIMYNYTLRTDESPYHRRRIDFNRDFKVIDIDRSFDVD